MKKTINIILGLLLATLSLTSQDAIAQERRPDPAKVQELRQRIQQAKHERLKTVLGLDQETSPKFFEHYNKAERDIEQLARQRRDEMQRLGNLMKGAGSDADVDPAMNKVRELNKQIEQRRLQLDNEVRPLLSSRQRAKLLMFEQQFNKRVRHHRQEQMERQHQKERMDGRKGGPGGRRNGDGHEGEGREGRGRGKGQRPYIKR